MTTCGLRRGKIIDFSAYGFVECVYIMVNAAGGFRAGEFESTQVTPLHEIAQQLASRLMSNVRDKMVHGYSITGTRECVSQSTHIEYIDVHNITIENFCINL